MDWDIDDSLGKLIKVLAITCAISVPFGLWKLTDLVMLASHHFSLSVH
jgi:hypothetical protein